LKEGTAKVARVLNSYRGFIFNDQQGGKGEAYRHGMKEGNTMPWKGGKKSLGKGCGRIKRGNLTKHHKRFLLPEKRRGREITFLIRRFLHHEMFAREEGSP